MRSSVGSQQRCAEISGSHDFLPSYVLVSVLVFHFCRRLPVTTVRSQPQLSQLWQRCPEPRVGAHRGQRARDAALVHPRLLKRPLAFAERHRHAREQAAPAGVRAERAGQHPATNVRPVPVRGLLAVEAANPLDPLTRVKVSTGQNCARTVRNKGRTDNIRRQAPHGADCHPMSSRQGACGHRDDTLSI